MKKIDVRLEEQFVDLLDDEAKKRGISRAELVRERVVGKQRDTFTPHDYNKLVSDAHRYTHGSLSRNQVESLVAFVFNRMATGSSGL